MKVVIFAGGRGTRISEESSLRPKPMIEIGGKPILWHIMKIYAAYGHTEFIICLGYKAHIIKEYFANYFLHNADITVDLSNNSLEVHRTSAEPFKISLIDTGLDTMTAGRLKRVLPYVGNEPFMLTYGDGVCDVDLNEVLKFHKESGKICTMTAIQATSRFGVLKMEEDGTIDSFEEKPADSGTWINGGFFVVEPEIAKYLHDDADDIMWERQPMDDLARDRQIAAYRHHSFWKCMDTLRDKEELEQMWQTETCMEKVVKADYLRSVFNGKRVLLTGHTGFKGAWMLQILHWLGANVKGYSLAPEKDNDLYNQIKGDSLCYSSVIADICDAQKLQTEVVRFEPDFVFHLAAQPLVRRGYELPAYTFLVNSQGTAHMLDAMRGLKKPAAGVMITTDKVYDNPERGLPFEEDDKLGGYDPYSASKAAAEIVIDSYRRSFFNPADHATHQKSISAARAGNVIGGGDYSDNRIIPDIVRSISFGETVGLRNPNSIRPWQHVLEPLGAYLLLAAKMTEDPIKYSTAYNFGPNPEDMLTVEELTKVFVDSYGAGSYKVHEEAGAPHEAKLLLLNSNRAMEHLGWKSQLDARTAIQWTAEWYADKQNDGHSKCMAQIERYF